MGWEDYAQVSALPVCVNPGRAFNCYWEMPFRKRAKFTIQNLSDEQIVERSPDIIRTLMAVVVEADRKGDQAALEKLVWFTDACDAEFDEARTPPQAQHDA